MSLIAEGNLPADCKMTPGFVKELRRGRRICRGGLILYKYMRIYLWSALTVEVFGWGDAAPAVLLLRGRKTRRGGLRYATRIWSAEAGEELGGGVEGFWVGVGRAVAVGAFFGDFGVFAGSGFVGFSQRHFG